MTDILESHETKRYNMLVVFFIYISIFINSYVFFKKPFEFQFGYLIYIVLLPGYISRFGINRSLFFIFFVLLLTGIANILLGNNSFDLFLKVFTGLTLSYFFYYYVILEYNKDIEQLFKWYLKGAYIASLLGYFQFICFQVGFEYGYRFGYIFNKWGIATGGLFGIRINSVFAEPTHLGAVLSAAFFVAVYNMMRKESYYLTRFQNLAIIGIYFLSFSGLGQGGIFLTLVLLAFNFGLVRYLLLAIPAGAMLFIVLYNNVKDFRERFDGLTGLFSGEKFKLGRTHGSSFILYNNYVVTIENFKDNFAFGTGIGSHPVAFDKYSLAKEFKVVGFNSNGADANSMFLRLVSETGLFGTVLFFIIMIKGYVRRDPEYETNHWLISNSILIMILLNLFRQGHYFLNGFPFFVILYYFNYLSYREYVESDRFIDVHDEFVDSPEAHGSEKNSTLQID